MGINKYFILIKKYYKDKYFRNYINMKYFWFIFTAIIFGLLLLVLENTFILFLKDYSFIFFYSLFYFDLLYLILFYTLYFVLIYFIFKKPIKRQKIRGQPSWVFYYYWGLTFAPLLSYFFSFSFIYRYQPIILKIDNDLMQITINLSFRLIILIFLILIYKRITPISLDEEERRFAAGAAGINDDKLDYKYSARNVNKGILKKENYINVCGLYGGMGFGKSSYLRMIIEYFNQENLLYTYISLTETNEAKDFSKLFAERWFETLSFRYPKFDTATFIPAMHSILRESGDGLLSSVFESILKFNPGLIKTKAKYFDKYFKKKNINIYTSSNIAKLFGNVPEYKEKLWVIVIDEIERALLDEIYRAVEIIERFKNEGRSGLPIKIVFILCISQEDLKNLLDNFKNKNQRANLLQDFFFDNPKNITLKIFLPPTDLEIKQKYINDEINNLAKRNKIKLDEYAINIEILPDPTYKYSNHYEALTYIVRQLVYESPRINNRCFDQLDFDLNTFRDKAGKVKGDTFRFSDLLIFAYIKIQYPEIIDFLKDTLYFLLPRTFDSFRAYKKQKELKDSKKDIIGWFVEVTETKLSDTKKTKVKELLSLIAYSYIDFIEKDYNLKNKDQYLGSLSYPDDLYDYLHSVSGSIETPYKKYNKMFIAHRNKKIKLDTLDDEDLTNYSRYLGIIEIDDIKINKEVLQELTNRIINSKIQLEPMNLGDTIYDEVIYMVVFQILSIIERDNSNVRPSVDLKFAFSILKKILTSDNINTGAKLIILNSYANNKRGSGSEIHTRFDNAFKKLLKYYDKELREIINHVINEAYKRYFIGDEVIYENEENFFYVMYQWWSGNPDRDNSQEELNLIRGAAFRNLEKYHKAVDLYWGRFPYEKGWNNFNDVLNSSRFDIREKNIEVYMPLQNLINFTKEYRRSFLEKYNSEFIHKINFWQTIIKTEKYKEVMKIKKDSTTLKAVLIERKFINR